jgi:hypothetical protein
MVHDISNAGLPRDVSDGGRRMAGQKRQVREASARENLFSLYI